ncbi:glycosyltransferase family 2 protein [Nocardia barduliensis]|uniref:glycosyltransferase family 2 protein n=1 Tax=Nocardia barduliensis TaxID=2736643 RepID=UPI001573D9DC|nr:glycosyltransferase family 2 protein [Nocardia barduliensis]
MRPGPTAVFVIPAYNRAATLRRCVISALRQQGVTIRVVLVDHGSSDGTAVLADELARAHPELVVVSLRRGPAEVASPSRPLNEGIAEALRLVENPEHTWIFRLDADDFLTSDTIVAEQLAGGGLREVIMATLTFFDQEARTAYEYGPRLDHRTLSGLPGRDVYAVAHHATAMRADLLTSIWPPEGLYDPVLETGEDLGVTCRIVRAMAGDETKFSFVPAAYCYKGLAKETITGSLPLRRVWKSHRKLLRDCPELGWFAVLRGLAELGLSRVVGEGAARPLLQHCAGRNGHYQAVDYSKIRARMGELSDPAERTSVPGTPNGPL